MTTTNINEAAAQIEQTEKTFEIDLLNKVSGVTYANASVLAANTLDQILQEYAADLGINPSSPRIIFENKRTGASTSDSSETIGGLELMDGDILALTDDGAVA